MPYYYGYGFGIDSLYLLVVLVCTVLGLAAQSYINSTYKTWSKVRSDGDTGAAVARRMLDANGCSAVGIKGVAATNVTFPIGIIAAALALLNDAVKKGGLMASSSVGGLSGAFIPVSEDEGMIAAASSGALTLDKLEAMTCVCSVGLDMIAVPGDTTAETISAIIADEAAIGMINNKTTAVRIIPAVGTKVGDTVEFGGLLGSAPVQAVHPYSSAEFIARGGRIPAPLHSLKN